MNIPNNTNIAPVNFSGMKSVQEPETSPRLIVWLAFGIVLCICLGASAWILF